MRIGVIRGDMPGPVFVGDLESTSQTDFPVEPLGQTRYVSRPDLTVLGNIVSKIPASLASTSDIVFPLTIDNTNHTLLVRAAGSGLYTTVTIANAVYANTTTLLAAINAALTTAGVPIVAIVSVVSPNRIALRTTGSLGPGAAIGIDSVGNGSTANTPLGLGSAARGFTMPTVASTITALLPVGGPLDVSLATLLTTLGGGLTVAELTAIQDAIAPHFVDTNVAIQSFKKGNIAGLRSANFNPDPNRRPPISSGAAITVVTDDGVTLFTGGLPFVTTAVLGTPNTGDLTVSGTDLGNPEQELVTVKLSGAVSKSIAQKIIETTNTGGTQGSVSATSIVIPASLIPGATTVTTSVQVKVDSFASNILALS